MQEYKFLQKQSEKLSRKYPGKYLAIVGSKVAAVSSSSHEAFKKAKEKFPDKKIHISYMPTQEEVNLLI